MPLCRTSILHSSSFLPHPYSLLPLAHLTFLLFSFSFSDSYINNRAMAMPIWYTSVNDNARRRGGGPSRRVVELLAAVLFAVLVAGAWSAGLISSSRIGIAPDGPDADVDTVADAGRATDGADGAGRPRVVVSVSTFAGRVQDANATIASLLDQDYILDAIYLHVPPAIERLNISGTLTESDSAVLKFWDGRVSVRRPVDLGPTTKLIGALYAERDPDTIVITVDGDVVSRPGM
ncbi:hypothetical protein CXG81DRAFT_20725, partial [Caulochytrium protostelioides]